MWVTVSSAAYQPLFTVSHADPLQVLQQLPVLGRSTESSCSLCFAAGFQRRHYWLPAVLCPTSLKMELPPSHPCSGEFSISRDAASHWLVKWNSPAITSWGGKNGRSWCLAVEYVGPSAFPAVDKAVGVPDRRRGSFASLSLLTQFCLLTNSPFPQGGRRGPPLPVRKGEGIEVHRVFQRTSWFRCSR